MSIIAQQTRHRFRRLIMSMQDTPTEWSKAPIGKVVAVRPTPGSADEGMGRKIDDDRAVFAMPRDNGVCIQWRNGAMVTSTVLSKEAAEATRDILAEYLATTSGKIVLEMRDCTGEATA